MKLSRPYGEKYWCRIILTLTDLHNILQKVMGWRNRFLFSFDLEEYFINRVYDPSTDKEETTAVPKDRETYKEMGIRRDLVIKDFFNRENQRIKYTYKFKYNWVHTIIVEKILQIEEGENYPVCTKGKRACPPDTFDLEVRGASQYMGICEELQEDNSKHKSFKKEYKQTYGREFDPEYFNLNEINRKLEQLKLENI